MTEKEARRDFHKLEELKEEIKNTIYEMRQIIKKYPGAKDRAESYPIAHILISLDHNHGYMSRDTTIQDIAEEIRDEEWEEDEEGKELEENLMAGWPI
jgi:hypothetical protein